MVLVPSDDLNSHGGGLEVDVWMTSQMSAGSVMIGWFYKVLDLDKEKVAFLI